MIGKFLGFPLRRPGTLLTVFVLFGSLTGCQKKSGEAIVLTKEHIAIAETPVRSAGSPAATPVETPAGEEDKPIGPGADDITVDSYVMNKDLRGTSKDPRATDREQWLVKVRMVEGGRQFNVQAEPAQYKS